MPTYSFTQYQIKTEAPPAALGKIQQFTSWFQPLSEPVRIKPGIKAHLQQFTTPQTPPQPDPFTFIQGWFQPLSSPVRIKLGVLSGDQPFFFFEPEPPEFMEIPWYAPLSEPVRLPIGLKAPYQQFLAYHPRILPPTNVTVTMAATETNEDVAIFAINVYNAVSPTTSAGTGAKVSVVEIPVPGNDPSSVRED